MKIALFSDLHAHPFKPYAHVLENGMNSRLSDAVSCIEQIRIKCIENDVSVVLFGGDMFHVRRNINVSAFNAVYEELSKFKQDSIEVVMIHGNHDQADRYGDEHSIHAFRSFAHIIDKPGCLSVNDRHNKKLAVLGVPYTENIEHLRQVVGDKTIEPVLLCPRLMLGHLGIQGAKVGADFVYTNPNDAAVSDLSVDQFDAVYLGHYHMHQKIARNAWYIGAPLQHNWGDSGQWRGFLIYDTDTGVHEKVTLSYPRFMKIEKSEDMELTNGDYVRLACNTYPDEEWISRTVEVFNCQSLEIITPDKAKSDIKSRLNVDRDTNLHDALEKYVTFGNQPTEGLEESYLMQIGSEILAQVENDEG